jgi:hypothetical protein
MKTHSNDKLKALQKATGGYVTIYFQGTGFAMCAKNGRVFSHGKSIDECCDKIMNKFKKELKKK